MSTTRSARDPGAAPAAGADHVDVTGDGPAHDHLSRIPAARDHAIVLAAGVLPGLSVRRPPRTGREDTPETGALVR
ncbi:hypothetical protein [Nocardiopsis alborubida]|uniref:hypothetical protein n=1 Tax=Nocardiopsis alborubida TaxID=146802 RepID=UPI00076E2E3C|nr:hypothetical protein [Nocardiopsis alborubida]